MSDRFTQVGRPRALAMWADWTDRIAGGELPTAAPPRPQGRERNVVVTMWDWADPKAYLHDEIASDKRNPTVNANGPIYGALEASADYMPVVDPMTHTATQVKLTVRDPKTPSEARHAAGAAVAVLGRRSDLDQPGQRAQLRDGQAGARLDRGAHPSEPDRRRSAGRDRRIRRRKAFPINQSGRQMQMYDPKTKKVTTIDTCFGTHHLNFDNNDVLWFTGGGPVEGWFDTQHLRQDQGRAEGAGLDGVRPRHQRQRQARRVRRAGSAARSRPRTSGSTRRSTAWRRARSTARSGDRCSACPARSCA